MGEAMMVWSLCVTVVALWTGSAVVVGASRDYGLGLLNDIMVSDPTQLCFYITCQEPALPTICPEKTIYFEGTSQYGCCGSCVAFKQSGEACTGNIDPAYGQGYTRETSASDKNFFDSLTNTSENNIVQSWWCDYNLYCNDKKICKAKANTKTCMTMLESYTQDTADANKYKPYRDDYRWKPVCTREGMFAARQCKGPVDNQRCVCVDPDGNRLYGAAFPEQEELFSTMNCMCSRRVWEKHQAGESSVTLHCLENGNFEALQCEDELCYCVEPSTGNMHGPLLPYSAMHMLPCYNKTLTGEQYLRRCESEHHAHIRLVEAMRNHGVKGPESLTQCDEDGSYASRQCEQGTCQCWDKYKSKSINFPAGDGCQCARDREYHRESGSLISVTCENTAGTYIPQQTQGSYKYCVDQDGIRSSPMVFDSEDFTLQCEYAELCQQSGSYCDKACILVNQTECPEEAYAYTQISL